ncbi:hypothetical protein N8135_01355 [Oceanospirillaceae bacterium]|nr:hypothetical protein [Oceanospirillaceae bacterium]
MKYTAPSYKQVRWVLQIGGWMTVWASLLLAVPSAVFALSNSDIVNATSPSSVYMRKGFELSDGSIKELVSHKTGVSLYYCNPVSVRANPDINARKITSINDGNFETFDLKASASAEGWADVFKDGRHIGYSAQAVKKDGQVDNIICPQPKWLTLSTLEVAGVQFNAELIDQRDLIIKDGDGIVLYTRRVSDKTSLYELNNANGIFGWIVGWDLYDDSQYFKDIDFTVARVVVPYLDEKGNQEVWDAVYQGVQNLKFLSMLSDVHGQVPIVAGLGVRGPRFCNSNACAWHWKQPIFVTIKRTSNGIEEIIDNGAFDFQLVKGMTRADQFLYNWLYWNPGGLRKLLQGQIGQQIEAITTQCTPSKLALYKHYFIPQWEWASPLHYDRSNRGLTIKDQAKNHLSDTEYESYYEDRDASYAVLLDYLWGPETNGHEYFYSLMDCVEGSPEDRELVRNIVGYLNLPLDADLLKVVIDQRK